MTRMARIMGMIILKGEDEGEAGEAACWGGS
jgi:hypothetical protein